jgi:hypothetical protein
MIIAISAQKGGVGKTAREIKNQLEKEQPTKGRPRHFTRIIKPEGKLYKITVQIRKPQAEVEEVIEALCDAVSFLTHAESKPEITPIPSTGGMQ